MLDTKGLYYNRARSYDSRLGRFLGEDARLPFGYAYGANNPGLMVDPTGQEGWGYLILSAISIWYVEQVIEEGMYCRVTGECELESAAGRPLFEVIVCLAAILSYTTDYDPLDLKKAGTSAVGVGADLWYCAQTIPIFDFFGRSPRKK